MKRLGEYFFIIVGKKNVKFFIIRHILFYYRWLSWSELQNYFIFRKTMFSYGFKVWFGFKIQKQTGTYVFIFLHILKLSELSVLYSLLYFIVVRIHIEYYTTKLTVVLNFVFLLIAKRSASNK
jgi:hypothetical protein